MRPPFPYCGAKQTLARAIVDLMRVEHRHYVEPFAGSLAVLLAKPRVSLETVNDVDGRVMQFWRVLRERGDELAAACALTPHSRAEFEAASAPCTDPVEAARRTWVRLTQSFGGTLRDSAGWRHYQSVSAQSSTSMSRVLAGYVERMGPVMDRISGVSLECRSGVDVVRDYGRSADTLLYLDPPYVGQARSSKASAYAHEMWSMAAHEELLEAVTAARAAVLISGYDHPLYRRVLADWQRVELPGARGNGAADRDRREMVWVNFPLTPTLF